MIVLHEHLEAIIRQEDSRIDGSGFLELDSKERDSKNSVLYTVIKNSVVMCSSEDLICVWCYAYKISTQLTYLLYFLKLIEVSTDISQDPVVTGSHSLDRCVTGNFHDPNCCYMDNSLQKHRAQKESTESANSDIFISMGKVKDSHKLSLNGFLLTFCFLLFYFSYLELFLSLSRNVLSVSLYVFILIPHLIFLIVSFFLL